MEATPSQTAAPAPLAEDRTSDDASAGGAVIAAEVLVEEISIDGMCGVY